MPSTSIHIGTDANLPVKKITTHTPQEREVMAMSLNDRINYALASLSPVKTLDKVTFFRLLATMINAGISIVKALSILKDQVENYQMKKVIKNLLQRIEAGTSLSEAMSEYNKVFSEAQVGMVESGEASGRLNQSLLSIADEMEKSAALLSKVKGAMIYPIVVITIMLGAGFAVMTYVIPKVKEMFESMGGELPPSTQALIKMTI